MKLANYGKDEFLDLCLSSSANYEYNCSGQSDELEQLYKQLHGEDIFFNTEEDVLCQK